MSQQAIVGMALVVAGGFFLPMKRVADWGLRSELKLSIALALVAALGTAGYSIIDDAALRLLREAPGTTIGHAQVTLLYAFLEGISSSSWLALFVLAQVRGRARLCEVCRTRSRQAALTGAGIYLTYTLVLISMAFVTDVSYVVAFRQLSIPLGALLGVFVLKEPRPMPKFVGVTTMLIGLVLIGSG